jgi:stage II sporulation protein P
MKRINGIYFSWRAVGIMLLLYALFLTGFSFGAQLTPSQALAIVLSTEGSSPDIGSENILILTSKSKKADAPKPQAVIYCTHTSEEYADQTRKNGVAGGVLQAARELAEQLESAGIGVLLLENIFDSPNWNYAYGNSLAAIELVKKEYPDIELFIDIHRDARIVGLNTKMASAGISYARMLLVIGSDANLPHPHWQSNQEFANQLNDTIDDMVPGIMREPKIYSGRYNQHIGKQAILVEIGSQTNTIEEAKNSAGLLAEGIAKVLGYGQ